MKLFSIAVFLLLCMETYAQEKFNNVYYDTDGNISNTVIPVDDGFVVLTGTSVNGGRGIGFSMINHSGTLLYKNSYKLENYECYEAYYNCLKYSDTGNYYYMCGTAVENNTSEIVPFLVLLDDNLDTLSFNQIEIDSVYGVYDVIQYNDSIFAIAAENILPDDYEMGLLLYNINDPTHTIKTGYGVDGIISNEVGTEIIKTHDNKLLLGGFTFGFSTSTYKQDWYLVKTDSMGNMLWERYYGNPSENDGRIMAMLEAQDSTYVLAGGQAICNWSMDPILEACLRKVDTAGNLVWERFYRTLMYRESAEQMWYSDTYIVDITELPDKNLISLLEFQKQLGSRRLMLMKTTLAGNILWTKRLEVYNTSGSFYPSSLKSTDDSGFIINGYGEISTGQQFYLIKTDSLGCEGAIYQSPPPENIECVNLPDTIFCGIPNNFKLRVQGKSAPYTIEFSTGEIIEDLYYPPIFIPESQGTGFFSVHVGTNTYYHTYNSATLYSEIPSDDKIEMPFSITVPYNYEGPELSVTITNGYGETYQIVLPVYVDCNVSSEPLNETAAIQVYPNPATDYLQIELPDENETSFVKILNLQGQTVLVQPLQSRTTRLDISDLATGTYLVRLYYGHRIENVRMEKQ